MAAWTERFISRTSNGPSSVHFFRPQLAALDRRGQLGCSIAFLDGSFAPAKKGGAKVGVAKQGKGTKWMLVVDGHGQPLGFHLDSANMAEVTLAE